jgi:hypothetical protein
LYLDFGEESAVAPQQPTRAKKKACTEKCIFIKSQPSEGYPKGRWKKVFDGCSGAGTCRKAPGDALGKPGEVFTALCGAKKASKSPSGKTAPPSCMESCQWTCLGGDNWQNDHNCSDPRCRCDPPPNGLGANPGDHYSTDCKPRMGKGKKKRKG